MHSNTHRVKTVYSMYGEQVYQVHVYFTDVESNLAIKFLENFSNLFFLDYCISSGA